jgi:hypothetical protein
VNERYKVALVAVVISVLAGSYWGYLIAIESQPIEKAIRLPETATKKLVKQAYYEHHRVGNMSYLTTGPIFSQFVYSCEPGPGSYASGGPSCLALAYDGKPGLVQLEIPKYLISEFPKIDEVYFNDLFSVLPKQIPFQVTEENNSYVTVRIDIPSNHTGLEISGRTEGSLSSLFFNRLFGWGFSLSVVLFIVCLIVYWFSKKYILQIRNNL